MIFKSNKVAYIFKAPKDCTKCEMYDINSGRCYVSRIIIPMDYLPNDVREGKIPDFCPLKEQE